MEVHYSSDVKGEIPTSDNTAYGTTKQESGNGADEYQYEVVPPEQRELPFSTFLLILSYICV